MSATYPLRLDARLKEESQRIARKHGMSLNQYIKECLIVANVQEQTLETLSAYLPAHDAARDEQLVAAFLSQDFEGEEPGEEIDCVIREVRAERAQRRERGA
jgi:hypothetical protein